MEHYGVRYRELQWRSRRSKRDILDVFHVALSRIVDTSFSFKTCTIFEILLLNYRSYYLNRYVNIILDYFVTDRSINIPVACPSNYTRIGKNCYHLSVREFDWKSSANFCRGMGGNLVELETVEENQDLVSYLQATKSIKGKTFWTGGLNPGLLWIWAGSARPVHQDTKQIVHGDGRFVYYTLLIY